jgi:hypothetical protein
LLNPVGNSSSSDVLNAIATWMTNTFGVTALALREDLVDRLGAPPQIIWLTCGNTSNARLREILSSILLEALGLLPLVTLTAYKS